jgi:hypothetical protein
MHLHACHARTFKGLDEVLETHPGLEVPGCVLPREQVPVEWHCLAKVAPHKDLVTEADTLRWIACRTNENSR